MLGSFWYALWELSRPIDCQSLRGGVPYRIGWRGETQRRAQHHNSDDGGSDRMKRTSHEARQMNEAKKQRSAFQKRRQK
jgi:hypothetical protein